MIEAPDGATDEKPNKFLLPDGRTALCKGSDRLIMRTPAHKSGLAPAVQSPPDCAIKANSLRGAAHPRAVYAEAMRHKAIALYQLQGWEKKRIAVELGVHRKSVARWLIDAGIE